MNELTISLDPHRKTPLYEQIYGLSARKSAADGSVRGERLPFGAGAFGLSVGEPEYRGSGV